MRCPGQFFIISALCVVACATSGDLSLGTFPQENGLSSGTGAEGGTGGLGHSDGGTMGDAGALNSTGAGSGLGGEPHPPPCSLASPLPTPTRRFDFSGTGAQVVDREGGPSGEVIGGAVLDGSGALAVEGDAYVNLPNDILGSGESVSILVWATPQTGPAYWRIFDFGTSSGGEDPTDTTIGTYYIALTPETGFTPSGLAALVAWGGPSSEDRATTPIHVEDNALMAAVVFDGQDKQLRLYHDGEIVAEAPLSGELTDIPDVNNWLGRSQYSADPYFRGKYDELRIYERALSGCEISVLSALGPDNPG
jgi:hypothetical protein